MAGYDGYSMSNNAVDAYESGERPLSQWSKSKILSEIAYIIDEYDLNVDYDEIKTLYLPELRNFVLRHSSWHHTSKFYNATDFYSIDPDLVEKLTHETIEEIKSLRDKVKTKPEPVRFKGTIVYIVWTGSRNHPRPNFKTLKDVTIEERGCFYYVFNDEGKLVLKKKIDSNGTLVYPCS